MDEHSKICTDTPVYPVAWRYAPEEGLPKVAWLKLFSNRIEKVNEQEIELVLQVNNLKILDNYLVDENNFIVGFIIYSE